MNVCVGSQQRKNGKKYVLWKKLLDYQTNVLYKYKNKHVRMYI